MSQLLVPCADNGSNSGLERRRTVMGGIPDDCSETQRSGGVPPQLDEAAEPGRSEEAFYGRVLRNLQPCFVWWHHF